MLGVYYIAAVSRYNLHVRMFANCCVKFYTSKSIRSANNLGRRMFGFQQNAFVAQTKYTSKMAAYNDTDTDVTAPHLLFKF